MAFFDDLHTASDNPDRLRQRFANLLDHLCNVAIWDGQSSDARRILWSMGKLARKAFPADFSKPGLYLWGIDEHLLYIGITTKQTLRKRLRRYIGGGRSQCALAQANEAALKTNGFAGFPQSQREWLGLNPTYRSRFRGAVRFAEEGIDRIWFALLPHSSDPSHIESLEERLIPVADGLTVDHGFRPLLNVQYNRGSRTKK